jgi:hypothetical protein
VIGTLNEGALHAQLKEWYRRDGDRVEERVGPYVVDLVRDGLLVEIQTGGFAPLRRKLEALVETHRVRVVAPVALSRRIVRLSDAGEVISARRSPKAGRIEDVFARLVSISSLVAHEQFELEVVLTHEDELRVHCVGRARSRRGWVVAGRALRAVEQSILVASAEDAVALLPKGLPPVFDTAELASAAGCSRRTAQQIAYCLRECRGIERVGKRGRAATYRTCVRNRLGPVQIDL